MKNGMCIVRNHRAMCACPEGLQLDSEKNECVTKTEAVECAHDGQTLQPGKSIFSEKCKKKLHM